LEHFEKVHGKAFVFMLEKLDRLMGGEDEGFVSEKIQFKQSTD